jgi:type IV secretion system protein VirB6
MGDIQWQVFAYIVSQVEAPLVSAVADVFNAFLTFVASPLKVALVLYIALTGALIIRGETNEAGAPLLGRILKMSLVVWIITGAGAYQQYVYDFFFTTLPSGLSNALTSSGSINVISANSFDQVWLRLGELALKCGAPCAGTTLPRRPSLRSSGSSRSSQQVSASPFG